MCIAGHIHPFQGLDACLDTVTIQYTPDVWRDQTYDHVSMEMYQWKWNIKVQDIVYSKKPQTFS